MMTALLVLAALALFITFVTSIVVLGLQIVVARDIRDILTLTKMNTTRSVVMDRNLTALTSTIMSLVPPMPPFGPDPSTSRLSMGDLGNQPPTKRPHVSESFETEDGRHSDATLKGLLEKILHDPHYKITRPEDIERLKGLFNEHMESPRDPRDPPVQGSSGGVFPTPPPPPPDRIIREDDIPELDDSFDEEDEDDGS